MICCKNEHVFIRDLTDLASPIIFDTWWDSMNVDSKRPIAWNISRHAPSWRLYLPYGVQETGSPGIICIVCHQDLRLPSQYGTCSMGKHLLAKAHIAKLHQVTETEVTELTSLAVDETALAIQMRHGHRGITMVCSPKQFIFDIHIDPY
jgi:hypothetical protein